jgi:hypothetical protein
MRKNAMRRALGLALSLLAVMPASPGLAQKRKTKEGPKVLMALPLGVPAGATTRLTLRGLKLDSATEVRCLPKCTVKFLKKNKVAVPNQQDVNRVGDSAVEIDLTVPADVPAGPVTVAVKTPGGESAPHKVLIDRAPVLREKEPNNGFRDAQPVELGQVVQGVIDGALDVDTFRFAGRAGQQVVLEVHAARHGSALDSILMLYDDKGQKLAENDDFGDSTDSRIEITLPRTGSYYAVILDAHDQGGATHVYRFSARMK